MGVSDVSSNQTKDGEESMRMSCYAASTRSSSSSSSSHCCPPPRDDDGDETQTTTTTNCCHYRYCCLLACFHKKIVNNNITTTPTLASPNNNRRRTPATSSTVPPVSSSSLLPPSASSPASPSPSRRCRRLCFGRTADSTSSSSPGYHPGHKEQGGRSATPCKRAPPGGVMARSRPCCCCQSDIVGFAIKCDQCVDIDLCLECFSLGAEVGPHKKDHRYRIMSDMLGPFDIPKPWSLVEETMLLDAVEQYGFGNWHDVANHVESRTAAECQNHYVSFYLFGNIGKFSVPCCNNYSFGLTNEDSVPNHKKTLNNATNNNNDSESLLLNHQKPLNNATNNDEHDWGLTPVENNHIEQPDLGFVLFRDDYGKTSRCRRKKKTNKKSAWKRSSFLLNDVTRSELEYDNDAESLISSLSVELDDEDIDIAFKLTQVDNYRLRLQEREQRKRVAHDYGLFHYSGGNKLKSPNSKRKTTKIDREFQEKLRVFAQFNTFQEHVQYYENLARERELKNRIRELFRFRKNGLMTLAEVVLFKNRKYKRDRRKNIKNQPPFAGRKGVNGFRRNRRKIRFTRKRTRRKR